MYSTNGELIGASLFAHLSIDGINGFGSIECSLPLDDGSINEFCFHLRHFRVYVLVEGCRIRCFVECICQVNHVSVNRYATYCNLTNTEDTEGVITFGRGSTSLFVRGKRYMNDNFLSLFRSGKRECSVSMICYL